MSETTNVSYRYAVEPEQGVGFIENTGDDWVMAIANTGAVRIPDDDGLLHTCMICVNDGLLYDFSGREGPSGGSVEKIHKDKVAADGSGGTDIVPELTFPEDTGTFEHYYQGLLESHIYVRPYKQSDGYPSGIQFDVYFYEDGEEDTHTAKAENVVKDGDISTDRDVDAQRVQMKLVSNMGQHIVIGRQVYLKSQDVPGGPSKTESSEMGYQESFADPYLRIGNVNQVPHNTALGQDCGGSYDSLTTGPDSQERSAIKFTGSQGLTASMIGSLSGDFTIQFMVKDITAPLDVIKIGTTLTISIEESGGVYSVRFNDGTNNISQNLTWTNSGWVFIEIERSGTNLVIREGTSS